MSSKSHSLVHSILFFVVLFGIYYLWFLFRHSYYDGYNYWTGTIIAVWADAGASEGDREYPVGRGQYTVLASGGGQHDAITHLREDFKRLDCVQVRLPITLFSYQARMEIVGRVDECWKPPDISK